MPAMIARAAVKRSLFPLMAQIRSNAERMRFARFILGFTQLPARDGDVDIRALLAIHDHVYSDGPLEGEASEISFKIVVFLSMAYWNMLN